MRAKSLAIPGLLLPWLLLGCAVTPPQSGETSPPSATSGGLSPTSESPDGDAGDGPTSTRSTSAAESFLLAQQIELTFGGDGIGPRCNESEAPANIFDSDPGVWLRSLTSVTEYYGLTVLCLRGFEVSAPIDVTLSAGDVQIRTRVEPIAGAPVLDEPLGYEDEPSTTLFNDGGVLKVYDRDYNGGPVEGPEGTLVSEMWTFVPPLAAREELGRTGQVHITAKQGRRQAEAVQPIAIPTTRNATLLTAESEPRLIIFGFPEGSLVPVGLYANKSDSGPVTLQTKLGEVIMPSSRVAEFTLPAEKLSDAPPGDYCVLPPVPAGVGCPDVTLWPEYPGSVSEGDEGGRVAQWQDILVQAQIMSDLPENHDGVYGPATVEAVRSYLKERELDNPDGGATLGRGFYDLLTR